MRKSVARGPLIIEAFALCLFPLLGMACGGSDFTLASDEGGAPPSADSGADASDASFVNDGRSVEGSLDVNMGADRSVPGVSNSGDCMIGECGEDRCVELTPGGYRTCVGKPMESTTCSVPAGDCCRSGDCPLDGGAGGKCVAGPAATSCGVVALSPNVCVYDACHTHEECAALGPQAICAPATAFGRKAASCLPAGCRVDADCKEEPGGACLTVSDPCCARQRVLGLYCVYRGRCRQSSDCAAGESCAIDNGRTRCVAGAPKCTVASP